MRKFFALATLFASGLTAQSLDTLAHEYRGKATPARRAPLQQYASAHPKEQRGALALFAMGVAEHEQKLWSGAIRDFEAASSRLPQLRDYIHWYVASAQFEQENYAAAAKEATEAFHSGFTSPVTGKAAVLAARSLIKLGRAREAVQVLRSSSFDTMQPQASLALGDALEAAGDSLSAVVEFQKVYFGYPLSEEADKAQWALQRLKSSLGDKYPPATAQAMITRADSLMAARQYAKAKHEYEAASLQAAGADRDVARVRMGACDFLAKQSGPAQIYLRSLQVQDPEAEAERLYYLVESARRMNDEPSLLHSLTELEKNHAHSTWRMEALISAGNAHWIVNRPERYVPLYRACYEAFPDQPKAAVCHWRVAWNAYLERRSEARGMMEAHLRTFPSSEQANAALYFLGRIEESAGDLQGASGCYVEIDKRYPNSYYAVLARQRLADSKWAAVRRQPPLFLDSITFPVRRRHESFVPDPATKSRIDRATLLITAGMNDLAEAELRFGAKLGEQPHILAIELARLATHRGNPDQGIRYVKAYVPNYLWFDFSGTPANFWKSAFPIPYRLSVEKWAKEYGLDPFLMAGLIRQESEFNPKALSRAKAYGLTQVLPSTGRSLARSAGMRKFSASMLFQPDVNLRLGSMYMRSLLGSHGGKVEYCLSSYNAGKARTDTWATWASFKDPAEFVESVPFTETRNYIQQVVRNADFYRRLYAGTTAEVTSVNGDAPANTASKPAAARKKTTVRKRSKR